MDLDIEPSLGVSEKMAGVCRLAAIKGLVGCDEPSEEAISEAMDDAMDEPSEEAAYAGVSTERGVAGTGRGAVRTAGLIDSGLTAPADLQTMFRFVKKQSSKVENSTNSNYPKAQQTLHAELDISLVKVYREFNESVQ